MADITKGEWKAFESDFAFTIKSQQSIVSGFDEDADIEIAEMNIYLNKEGEAEANAQLITAAPLGAKLADAIINSSATWIDGGLLEIGEATYLELKKLALEFRAKAEAK